MIPFRQQPTAALAAAILSAGTAAATLHPPGDDRPHAPTRAPDTAGTDRPRRSIDPSTGRDLLNYPPHRVADLRHIRLEIVVPDMNTPALTAVETLKFAPIAGELSVLSLRAAGLEIRSVTAPSGRAVTFTASPLPDDRLELTLNPPVAMGELAEVRIEYAIADPAEGLIWTPEHPAWPGRAASFHTQGEPESSRFWFAGHDFPNERVASEVIVTVPAGYTACSNGRRVALTRGDMPGTGAPAETFHFLQDKEHAEYLITLSVGKYEVVDVAGSPDPVPMPVYAPVGQGDRVRATFGRTPKMVSLFARLFGEPYPWDKYAQVVVTNFAWGGMENTSATNLYDTIILDKTALLDGDEDELIAHELAHQWFGDLLTCKSWEHIWLNEGWATYSEALWEQYKGGSVSGRAEGASPVAGLRADEEAYQQAVWSNFRSVIADDHADAPFQPAMVSRQYTHPDEVFDREANPYPKGAAVLHMLRRKLGDATFFTATAAYIDQHRNQPVETHQFRRVFEAASGLSLQRFFDQWCYRPGIPRLTVTPVWNPETRSLDISVEQTQHIDGANPAFFFDLTVAASDGGRTVRTTHAVETREAAWSVPCGFEPTMIVIDADLDVLAEISVVQPAVCFVEQLQRGPTLAARLSAAQHLARLPSPESISALVKTAKDNRAPQGLRRECVAALGRLAHPAPDTEAAASPETAALDALLALNPETLADAPVRRAWVEALGQAASGSEGMFKASAAEQLLARWSDDRSYAVRSASLRALGGLKAVEAVAAFEQGLATDSQDDRIRRGAIDGLASTGFPDALARILPFTAPGHPPGTRQSAIEAAVKLAGQDRERVFNVLAAVMTEAELRTRRAALEGLLELDGPRSRPLVEQFIAATRSRSDRVWAVETLRKHDEGAAAESATATP